MIALWLGALGLPWIGAGVLAAWPRRAERAAPAVALAFAAATAVAVTASLVAAPAGESLTVLASWPWVSALGLGMSWTRDGLTALFALLTAWVGALVVLFSGPYMAHAQAEAGSSRPQASYYALLSAFTGAMLGLVSAGHLLQFYLFWELTSLASFLLIGFWHHRPEAREGARRSLALTTLGSLAMMVGLIALGLGAGHWDFPALLAGRAAWSQAAWLGPVTALVLVGALSKSAQMPFSSWLPGAMAAPTPVSAYLHSSTLVAAGVYLLARFFPLLHGAPTWSPLLLAAGIVTGLPAGVIALRQAEMKALLAYSTVSQYAFFFLAFGLGSVTGAQAGLYAFFVHALIKAGLFLVAGAVTHLTGEKRFAALGGLFHSHPLLAAMAVVLALSLGGVPIFGGFYYKEELLHAAYGHQAWLLLASMLVGGMLTFLYMLRFLQEVFFGAIGTAYAPQRLPWAMGAPIAVLAGASLVTGAYPNWPNAAILNPAIASVVSAPAEFGVELHLSGVLALSLGVMAGALGLWALWRRRRLPAGWFEALPGRLTLGGARLEAAYGTLSEACLRLHDGNLRRYLRLELVALLVIAAVCWTAQPWRGAAVFGAIDAPVTAMLALSLVSAAATVWLRRHLVAAMALTMAGFALAGCFALMHAPGIALAQVLVETLATFSVMIALRHSRLIHPERTPILTAGRRDVGRWAIALGCGALTGWLTFWVGGRLPSHPLGAWYVEHAERLTGMRNMVTAILTDFRALDTAVEILVFTCAAFCVIGLFRTSEAGHE